MRSELRRVRSLTLVVHAKLNFWTSRTTKLKLRARRTLLRIKDVYREQADKDIYR